MYGIAKLLMAAGLAAAAAGAWLKDEPPPPQKVRVDALDAPMQTPSKVKPFDVDIDGVVYRVKPRYAYDISGVVVSLHHSDTWWDYAHKAWGDKLNTMDLCLAWGDTVRSGAYQDASFHNTQFECHWSYSSERARARFRNDEVSNNHIIVDDAGLAKAIKDIRVGDQVRLIGYLADYTTFRDGVATGTRVSSETRTDTGPGACEVLYLEGFDPVVSANRAWRLTMWAGLLALALGIAMWIALPVRAEL